MLFIENPCPLVESSKVHSHVGFSPKKRREAMSRQVTNYGVFLRKMAAASWMLASSTVAFCAPALSEPPHEDAGVSSERLPKLTHYYDQEANARRPPSGVMSN